MTPLEINKKICELKGIPLESFQVNGQKIYVDYKNWAESIQDAWGLFEEIVNEDSLIDSVRYSDNLKKWLVGYIDSDGCFEIESQGETAPLAICLAWIKWKESQR